MNAIVYTSNTGFTEKYAKLLSVKTGLPAYSMEEAEKAIHSGAEIIYMGWIMAGSVKGCEKAGQRYKVLAVCGVGMSPPKADSAQNLTANNHLSQAKAFYLQGGYDPEKLTGPNKLIMKVVTSSMRKGLLKIKDRTAEEEATLAIVTNGGDSVSENALEPVVQWLKSL